MPKTGGTYVKALMQKISKAKGLEFYSFNNLSESKRIRSLDQKLFHFLDEVKNLPSNKIIFVHHHHGYPGIQELKEKMIAVKEIMRSNGNEFKIFTTIREPIAFVTSKVNFRKEVNENSFKSELENSHEQNYMCKYLLHNHIHRWPNENPELNESSIDQALSLIDYTFTTKSMQRLVEFLNYEVDSDDITIHKKRNVGSIKFQLTESEKIKFKELNQWDFYLYSKSLSNSKSYSFPVSIKENLFRKWIWKFWR